MNVMNVLVNASAINKPKEETIRGVEVTTMLSPFDVPQSASCEFDDDSSTLTFKFTYLSDDKKQYTVNFDGPPAMKLTLGKTSNRVYEIEISQTCKQESQLKIDVLERALLKLKKLNQYPSRGSGSFDAVKSVLNQHWNTLMKPRSASC